MRKHDKYEMFWIIIPWSLIVQQFWSGWLMAKSAIAMALMLNKTQTSRGRLAQLGERSLTNPVIQGQLSLKSKSF